ncbi:MAG TPA: alpha-amylase family glycosyl hydrolase [Pseudonocardia sp.]
MQWWRGAVVYEVDVRSYFDADGNGVGDLDGLRARLGYLELLGIDVVWLEPSPSADHHTVDPRFGDRTAFDALAETAQEFRMQLVADLVRDDGPPLRHQRSDRLRLALNPVLRSTPFDAAAVQKAVQHSLDTRAESAWSLGHHDVSRAVTRYGGGAAGLARARAMALVTLALPGTVHVYQGEELGLPDVDRAAEARARVPLPWEDQPPGFGFTAGVPWFPPPAEYGQRAVARQLEDVHSTFSLYRRAIELRRAHVRGAEAELEWYGAPAGCLAFRPKGSPLVCALNTSEVTVSLPPGDIVLTSDRIGGRELAPDTAAWLV